MSKNIPDTKKSNSKKLLDWIHSYFVDQELEEMLDTSTLTEDQKKIIKKYQELN